MGVIEFLKMKGSSLFKVIIYIFLFAFAISVNAAEKYKTIKTLNIRSGPGPKFNIIEIIDSNNYVSVISKENPYWYKIQYGEKEGYLFSKYLILDEEASLNSINVNDQNDQPIFFKIIIVVAALLIIYLMIFKPKKKFSFPETIINNENLKPTVEENEKVRSIVNSLQSNLSNKVSNSTFKEYKPQEVPSYQPSNRERYNSSNSSDIDHSIINISENTALKIFQNNLMRITDEPNELLAKELNNKVESNYSYSNYPDPYFWKLGNKYKDKLSLEEKDVILLNKLWAPSNNFCSIEYCCIEVIKLFLATINALETVYIKEGTSLEHQFREVADVIAKKHFRYRPGSTNYKYSIESSINEIYTNIFKYTENKVREYFNHKRKISTDTYYTAATIIEEYESRIISKVLIILSDLVDNVNFPDDSTEIELYAQNTNRWKVKFDELIKTYDNPQRFLDNIKMLADFNKKNPSIENIFFDASKFIANYDKETSLKLYVYYLYYDLLSVNFDNKQLAKTIQKNLFSSNEQLHDFEIIISNLIQDKNLEKALNAIPSIYKLKRKKINLDSREISEVQQKHSGTVELLNEYLKDQFEDDNNLINTNQINNEEVVIEITQKNELPLKSTLEDSVSMSTLQVSAIEIFAKNNLTLSQSDLDEFAKSNGVFRDQLIESVNENCYELLDDLLIEKEDDMYIINPQYYQKLFAR